MRVFVDAGYFAVVILAFVATSVNAFAREGGGDAETVASVDTTTELRCRCVSEAGPNAARIKVVLHEPLHQSGLEFTEEPLETVINFLQDEYDISIQLDLRAIEAAGLTSDEPVTINLRSVSLRSAMRLMLKPKNLTYVIRHEVLLVTTPDEVESELSTCVYDVRDLVHVDRAEKDLKALTDAIVSCIAFETWAEHGDGAAQIKPLQSGMLVISQTPETHEEIWELLRAMRTTLAKPVTAQPAEGSEAPTDDLFDSGMGMDGGMSARHGGEIGGLEGETPFD